jgi:hypothetical protein
VYFPHSPGVIKEAIKEAIKEVMAGGITALPLRF